MRNFCDPIEDNTKILIVEDDIISCRALQKKAESWGYEVFTACNGEDAWNTIKEEGIRIAILDWNMPKMDGLMLCKTIRQEFEENESKYIYIIMLTGRSQKEDRIKGLTAGVDDYMTKPISFVELKVRLKNGERIIKLENSRIQLANSDGLTCLWNRNRIIEFLEEEYERSLRQGQPVGTIMIDIDSFKAINDTHGHVIGDKVLVEVSSRLKSSLRSYDKIGRYGGDEIFAVLPNCKTSQVKVVAERLRTSICSEPIQTPAGPIKISVSLGALSSESAPEVSVNELIIASDKAMYTAKNKGRNRLELANPSAFEEKRTFPVS